MQCGTLHEEIAIVMYFLKFKKWNNNPLSKFKSWRENRIGRGGWGEKRKRTKQKVKYILKSSTNSIPAPSSAVTRNTQQFALGNEEKIGALQSSITHFSISSYLLAITTLQYCNPW
jgi:hypothetical protein